MQYLLDQSTPRNRLPNRRNHLRSRLPVLQGRSQVVMVLKVVARVPKRDISNKHMQLVCDYCAVAMQIVLTFGGLQPQPGSGRPSCPSGHGASNPGTPWSPLSPLSPFLPLLPIGPYENNATLLYSKLF